MLHLFRLFCLKVSPDGKIGHFYLCRAYCSSLCHTTIDSKIEGEIYDKNKNYAPEFADSLRVYYQRISKSKND